MPPAFVLSQDQTLKLIRLSENRQITEPRPSLTFHVRAYSLSDAEVRQGPYGPLAACASLPSSSLVKQHGDLRLLIPFKPSLSAGGRAYTLPRHSVSNPFFFNKIRSLLQLPISPRSVARASLREAGFYAPQTTLSTDFFTSPKQQSRPATNRPLSAR
jgi:hypothetical protein